MLQKKSALGRGLGALIDSGEVKSSPSSDSVALELIEVNPFQPRQHFDEEALLELAASIREYGVIQPITVRELENGRYQIISGERRFRASRLAGLEKIPAFVRKTEDNAMLELALVENIQREDLDAIEVALSYQRLMEECGYSHEEMSARVGKKRATVTNSLRLLKLPEEIQLAIRARKISMGHARAILNLESSKLQIQTCLMIVEKDLSVRQTEEQVRRIMNPSKAPLTVSVNDPRRRKVLKAISERLDKVFSAEVRIQQNPEGKGKILISFNSDDELNRIIGLLDSMKA